MKRNTISKAMDKWLLTLFTAQWRQLVALFTRMMLTYQPVTIHDAIGMSEEPELVPLDQNDSMCSGMCTHNQPSYAGSKSTLQECEHGKRAAILPDDLRKLSDTPGLLRWFFKHCSRQPRHRTPDTDDVASPDLFWRPAAHFSYKFASLLQPSLLSCFSLVVAKCHSLQKRSRWPLRLAL